MAALAVLAPVQVVVVPAHLPDLGPLLVPARPPVVAVLAHHLPALAHSPARALLRALALRPVLAQLQAVVALAHLAVLVRVEVALQLTRSFSAAMAGTLPSPGPPMCAPAPRSRRKPNCRPCPSA